MIEKATVDNSVYVKVQKAMYVWLPQAEALLNQLLEKRLEIFWVLPKQTGAWIVEIQDTLDPIYTGGHQVWGQIHAHRRRHHLINTIKVSKYRVKDNWTGGKYIVGTAKEDKYTYPCQSMSRKRFNVSDTSDQTNDRTRHISTLCQILEQSSNTQ